MIKIIYLVQKATKNNDVDLLFELEKKIIEILLLYGSKEEINNLNLRTNLFIFIVENLTNILMSLVIWVLIKIGYKHIFT